MKTLGEIGYDALVKAFGYGGKTVPFEKLPQNIKNGWEAAAKAIIDECDLKTCDEMLREAFELN